MHNIAKKRRETTHWKTNEVYRIYNKALWKKPAHASLDGSAARGAPVKCCRNVTLQTIPLSKSLNSNLINYIDNSDIITNNCSIIAV